MPHLQPTDFDAANCSLCASTKLAGRWVLPTQRSSSTAAPTDACEPTSGKIKRSSGCYYPRRTVSNFFVPRLPGAHALRGILTETVLKEAFPLTQSESRPAWPWRWRANNKLGQNSVSLKGNYVWGGVSTQKWPSNQITMFERTRQSARFDAVTTSLIRSEWILVY